MARWEVGILTLSCLVWYCLLSSYTGQVMDGLRNGWGCYKCAGSNVVYTGEWKDGKRHGKVTMNKICVCFVKVYCLG